MRARYVILAIAIVLVAGACHSKKGGGYFAPTPVTAR
jgi:hypothetical protein